MIFLVKLNASVVTKMKVRFDLDLLLIEFLYYVNHGLQFRHENSFCHFCEEKTLVLYAKSLKIFNQIFCSLYLYFRSVFSDKKEAEYDYYTLNRFTL